MRDGSGRRAAGLGAAAAVLVLMAGCGDATSPGTSVEASAEPSASASKEWKQSAIRADLVAAAEEAGVGPEADVPLGGGSKKCAADWATFSPTTRAQVDTAVSVLREQGWKVTERRTHEKAGLTSLVKGPWTLQVIHRTPEGDDRLSLLALRDSPECERQ